MALNGSNGFRPWSEQEQTDLALSAEIGDSLQTAALFLGRSEEDVREAAAVLGLTFRDEHSEPFPKQMPLRAEKNRGRVA